MLGHKRRGPLKCFEKKTRLQSLSFDSQTPVSKLIEKNEFVHIEVEAY